MTKLWLLAALCTACTINGKAFGPGAGGGGGGGGGSSPAKGPAPTGVPTSSMTQGERWDLGAPDEGPDTGLPAYPSAPHDPWVAVKGDQPAARPRDRWTARSTKGDCSAAHDHCLEADTWFLVWKENVGRRDRSPYGSVTVFGPSGPLASDGNGEYTVYRTVPATRANMVPGAIVLGLPRPSAVPESESDAVGARWSFGVVTSVDPDTGVYRLEGFSDSLMLSGARVAVMKWSPGGKVEILGGKRRDQLAVRAKDVFLPDR